MKQGKATLSTMAGTKQEPVTKAVNVKAAANIGLAAGKGPATPMYEGRGLKAPMVGSSTHKAGSQGKH